MLKRPKFLFWMLLLLASPVWGQHFVANMGQWPEDFSYKMEYANAAVFVQKDGLRFALRDPNSTHEMLDAHGRHALPKDPVKYHAFEVVFGGSEQTAIHPQKKIETYHNYYLGKKRSKWRSEVPLYEELVYENLYPNTNLVLKVGSQNLKYDILLAPGANPAAIIWSYRGAFGIRKHHNQLIIQTSVGEVVEDAPIAWQIINNAHVPVKVAFRLINEYQVGFELGYYDPEFPLVIDPNFIFSTYTGSTADNFGYTATFDNLGNTFGGGIVFSVGYPVTLGAYQMGYGGGTVDVGISKFNTTGTQQLYATYLGGSQNEQPHSLVTDAQGNLYVYGITGSANFPTTPSAFDTTFNSGPNVNVSFLPFSQGVDIFIAKFNALGTALLGATFLGDSGTDGANLQLSFNYGDQSRGEIIVNSSGQIYFASSTNSLNFPVQTNSFQPALAGQQDAVLGKFTTNLDQLLWSTYLGGGVADAGLSIKLNPGENILYIAGGTRSGNDFPTFGNPYQSNFGGATDGFITSFNANTGTAIASTFNGTTNYDQNFFVEVDLDGDVYVFGQTKGSYPTSPGVWKNSNSSQFIQKFSPNLQQSLKSMVFGSGKKDTINISPTALMVDKCKSVYVSGWGGNVNYEGNTRKMYTTPGARDTTTDGSDFYFLVLDGSWQYPLYATYFGGNGAEHVDGGTSRFSPEGIIYQGVCAGCGGNSNFPAFPSSVWSTTNNSFNCNLAVFKVDFDLQKTLMDIVVAPDTGCVPHTLSWTDKSLNADIYSWDFGDGTSGAGKLPSKVYNVPGDYIITVIGVDSLCNTSDTIQLKLHIRQNIAKSVFTYDYDSCATPIVVDFFNGSKGNTANWWSFGDGGTSTQINPKHTYSQAGTYIVYLAVKDSFCNFWDTTSQRITLRQSGGFVDFDPKYDFCKDAHQIAFITQSFGYHTYYWDFGDGSASTLRSPTYSYSSAGIYTVKLTATDTVCNKSREVIKQVHIFEKAVLDENNFLPNVFTPNGDGNNDFWQPIQTLSQDQFTNFRIEVYNRWGSLVYSTANPVFGWNGTFENTDLAAGVYFWLAWYQDVCGGANEQKGVVHIVR